MWIRELGPLDLPASSLTQVALVLPGLLSETFTLSSLAACYSLVSGDSGLSGSKFLSHLPPWWVQGLQTLSLSLFLGEG